MIARLAPPRTAARRGRLEQMAHPFGTALTVQALWDESPFRASSSSIMKPVAPQMHERRGFFQEMSVEHLRDHQFVIAARINRLHELALQVRERFGEETQPALALPDADTFEWVGAVRNPSGIL